MYWRKEKPVAAEGVQTLDRSLEIGVLSQVFEVPLTDPGISTGGVEDEAHQVASLPCFPSSPSSIPLSMWLPNHFFAQRVWRKPEERLTSGI